MPSDPQASRLSPADRREFYRITATLPICLQPENDTTEVSFTKVPVHLSAGGIGVTVNTAFQANDILSCTLLLTDQDPFKVYLEVLRIDPLPQPPQAYRLHGRFIRINTRDRELLVRAILQLQREHLAKHYLV